MVFKNKKILLGIILSLFLIGVTGWFVYRYTGEKSLKITWPNGKEVIRANEVYRITWKSKNISRVSIILIKGLPGHEKVKWIATDIPAGKGEYSWKVFVWEEPAQEYKLAIFEYPWENGKIIDYSDDYFTILGPQFASCDKFSIEAEWPFVPSDFPNLKKVFITSKTFTGDLGRLDGADQKCQQEAEEKGYEGQWKAFLGDDNAFAKERLNLEGIFVHAEPSGEIPEGKFCHRLLGKNFDEFFNKLSESLSLNTKRFGENFVNNIKDVWLGRITQESKRECTTIFFPIARPNLLAKNYSFTTTCQNWTSGRQNVEGYSPSEEQQATSTFPVCFTPQGVKTDAVGIAGLSSGVILEEGKGNILTTSLAKSCNSSQRLLCIQQ